ncbi:MAG: hypothetical protein ACREXJ_12530 [Gammaproteobacteria bacterium]
MVTKGNDTIKELDGNDLICGGSGKDMLVGGRGRDRFDEGPATMPVKAVVRPIPLARAK